MALFALVIVSSALLAVSDGNSDADAQTAVPEPDGEIKTGQTVTVRITSAEEGMIYKFKADRDGIFKFESYGNQDTYAIILDQYGTMVTRDDDSGSGRNFRFSLIADEGEVFYIATTLYTESGTGSFTMDATYTGAYYNELKTVNVTKPGSYLLFDSGLTGDEDYELDIFVDEKEHRKIGRFDMGFEPENAILTVYAYDVDEQSGERDVIKLRDLTDETETELPGQYLHGSDDEWSTSTVLIDGKYLKKGHSYAIYDYETEPGWIIWIRNVSIQFSGDPYNLELSAAVSGTDVSLSLSGKLARGTYEVEYGIYRTADLVHIATINSTITTDSAGNFSASAKSSMAGNSAGVYKVDALIRTGTALVTTAGCTFSMDGYSINYNPNGGSNNVPSGSTYAPGDKVKVLFDKIPSRTGYAFLGWSDSKTAAAAKYTANGTDTFTITKNTTLYAVWQQSDFDVGTEFTVGNLRYTMTSVDPDQASVTGYVSGLTSASIPATVTYKNHSIAVVSVGEKAFYGCTTLKTLSVSAPAILQKAFAGCTALTTVKLTGVKSIGMYSFYGCEAFASVTFAKGLTAVGASAFNKIQFFDGGNAVSAAKDLAGKTFTGKDGRLTSGSAITVGTEFTVSNVKYTVTSVSPASASATGFVSGIKAASITASVTYSGQSFAVESVGEKAFYGCTTLTSASISAPAVLQKAFAGCTALTTVKLTGVKSIGAYSFFGCDALTSVAFAKDLASVGASSFNKIQFFDGGKAVSAAKSLAGKTFKGSDGKLYYGSSITIGTEFTVSNVKYTVTSVSPTSASATGFVSGIKAASIPASVTYNSQSFAVESVGEKAFYGCTTLASASVSAPSILQKAFAGCTALTTVKLTGVKSIGAYSFFGCDALTSVAFAKDLASVGTAAFSKVQFFDNGKSVLATAKNLAGKTFTGKDGKLYYGPAIAPGTEFTSSSIRYKVVSVNPAAVDAVGYSSGIKYPIIPGSVAYSGMTFTVSSVAEKAFADCATAITVKISAPTIGMKAFANCTALKTVKLLSCENIGAYAFYGDGAISTIEFSKDLKSAGTSAFGKLQFSKNGKDISAAAADLAGNAFILSGGKLCAKAPEGTSVTVGSLTYTVTSVAPYEVSVTGFKEGLKSLTVPASVSVWKLTADVTSIGDQAFLGCKTLATADLGDVKSIGFKAFAGCTALRAAWMFSAESIGAYAFYGCSKITVLEIPGVKTIGASAFSGCTGLSFASFSGDLAEVGSNAFSKVKFMKGTAELTATAKNLAGKTFAGAPAVLKLVS